MKNVTRSFLDTGRYSSLAAFLLTLVTCVPAGQAQPADLHAWIQSLRSPASQPHTAYAIPEIGDDSTSAAVTLMSALDDSDPAVRRYAAAALGDIGVHPARTAIPLVRLLDDESAEVRAQAVVALGKLGSPAIPALLRQLVDGEDIPEQPSPFFSPACQLGGRPPMLAAVALGKIGAAAVDELMDVVPRLDEAHRVLVSFAVSEMGPSVGRVLPEYLRHSDAAARATAAQAISYMSSGAADAVWMWPELRSALGDLLTDRDATARSAAAAALSLSASGIPPDERNRLVRKMLIGLEIPQRDEAQRDILIALGELGEDAAPARQRVLSFATAANSETANAAVEAIGLIGGGGRDAVSVLRRALRSGSDPQTAARSLAQQGSAGIDVLLESFSRLRSRTRSVPRRSTA